MKPILIVGSYLSPYVRKVLACLEVKGMAYEVDHLVPFFGDDRFSKLSPLRRIPVMVDGDLVLSDSSVICQYLEDKQPDPALFPRDIVDRAWARWLEEFADTRMGDVFIWRFFNQIAIRPSVWGEKGDREMVDRTLKEEIPTVLDYLEGEAPADGFRFGSTLSVADIAIAACLRQAGKAGGCGPARANRRTAQRAEGARRADQRRYLRRRSTATWRDADLVYALAGPGGPRSGKKDLSRAAHPPLHLRPCRCGVGRGRRRWRHARY